MSTPAGYRDLSFGSFSEVSAELDRIEASQREGTLAACGQWTPAQNLQHLAKTMRFSLDGFPFKVSAPLALMGRVMRPLILRMRFKPGQVKIPASASAMLPDEGVGFDEAMTELRGQLSRVERGERMDKPSALLGNIGHDKWAKFRLTHLGHHLGMLQPG